MASAKSVSAIGPSATGRHGNPLLLEPRPIADSIRAPGSTDKITQGDSGARIALSVLYETFARFSSRSEFDDISSIDNLASIRASASLAAAPTMPASRRPLTTSQNQPCWPFQT